MSLISRGTGLCLLILFMVAPKAEALPQYALKEGRRCVYCHFDPKGGGPCNARGRYYGKHFTFDGYMSKKKKVPAVKNATQNAAGNSI